MTKENLPECLQIRFERQAAATATTPASALVVEPRDGYGRDTSNWIDCGGKAKPHP